ncbi:MAG: hypothetical protein K2W85_13885 [Phycisphaerales bacterium]|nr:hypothetical protein [Phycisphaerales bacterium]
MHVLRGCALRLRVVWAGAVLCAGLASGCASPSDAVGFEEKDPGARLRAVQDAAETNDRTKIDELIELLASDDPAERLLAIRTLERITGETRGFEHSGTLADRREAIGRWAAWYRAEHGGVNGGVNGGAAGEGFGAENR